MTQTKVKLLYVWDLDVRKMIAILFVSFPVSDDYHFRIFFVEAPEIGPEIGESH